MFVGGFHVVLNCVLDMLIFYLDLYSWVVFNAIFVKSQCLVCCFCGHSMCVRGTGMCVEGDDI